MNKAKQEAGAAEELVLGKASQERHIKVSLGKEDPVIRGKLVGHWKPP